MSSGQESDRAYSTAIGICTKPHSYLKQIR